MKKTDDTNSQDYNKLNTNNVIDLRNTTNHPTSFLYSEIFSSAILNGRINHGRSQPGFSLDGFSPFVLAAKAAHKAGVGNKNQLEKAMQVLAIYYETVKTTNAADWLGLNLNINHPLRKMPPWGAVFPWRARSIESYKSAYENAAIKENLSVGFNTDITAGWLFCGPVSSEKIKIEAQRIVNVLNSIYYNGYQRSNESDGDARATALVNEEGDWRWLLTAGNHRASAASALGYKHMPVRVNLVINRCQARFWPHVVNKLYTEEQAFHVFDMFFKGKPPVITNTWINRAKEI